VRDADSSAPSNSKSKASSKSSVSARIGTIRDMISRPQEGSRREVSCTCGPESSYGLRPIRLHWQLAAESRAAHYAGHVRCRCNCHKHCSAAISSVGCVVSRALWRGRAPVCSLALQRQLLIIVWKAESGHL
jgi:hypothetical protein